MGSPFFSIILPTYNRALFLDRSVTSVIKQSFDDWELIIIDDGSTDASYEVVQKYFYDDRIKYHYQENKKLSRARNAGLDKVIGRYVCFLDSDDEFEVNHLEVFYQYLIKNNFPRQFLYTAFQFKDRQKNTVYLPPPVKTYKDQSIMKVMQVFLPFSPPVQSVCLPREICQVVRFDHRLEVSEAIDFCARCASEYEVIFLPNITVTLHGHDDNVSVPRSIESVIRFNTRKFKDFRVLQSSVFYKKIKRTKAFRKQLFMLQFDLARFYFREKRTVSFFTSLLKAIYYDPFFIKRIHLKRLRRKLIPTKSTSLK